MVMVIVLKNTMIYKYEISLNLLLAGIIENILKLLYKEEKNIFQ